MEAVIFYHSEQESTSGKFVGSKERVRIGLKSSHKSLNAFRNHVTTFCGIKDECVKRAKPGAHGKTCCQRTVRQETTKFKAGTLPLNMYLSSPSDYPKEKVYLLPTNMSKTKRFQPKRFKGRKRNKKKQTRKFLPTPRRKSRTSMTVHGQ